MLASADADAVDALRARLDDIGRIARFATYGQIEAKIVAARAVRTRFELIADKYAAATRDDESARQHARDQWLEENDAAIRGYNEFVATHGMLLDEYRLF